MKIKNEFIKMNGEYLLIDMVLETHITFPKVCGVLVELKRKSNIDILVENFQLVMPGRDLFFFCGKSSYDYYNDYYDGDNMIKIVNTGVDNFTMKQYNDFLKSLDFWDTFKDYTHVLTINTRGCLCENSEYKIEDFFKYDFVGGFAPSKFLSNENRDLHNLSDYEFFNGGFSFRRIRAIKDVINKFPPLPTGNNNENSSFRAYTEDLYFVIGLLLLNSTGLYIDNIVKDIDNIVKDIVKDIDNKDIDIYQGNKDFKKKYRVGLDDLATKFCSYTYYVDKTFCVNELDNNIGPQQLDKFLKYCPLFKNFMM